MDIEDSNWASFFDVSQDCQLMYKLQIVEAVIEEGENQDQTHVLTMDPLRQPKKFPFEIKKLPNAQSLIEKDTVLKKAWTSKFLEKGGFKYMLDTFMSFEVVQDSFKLMYASFMLKLLRFFMLLLISSSGSGITTLLRRKSSHTHDDEAATDTEEAKIEGDAVKEAGGEQLKSVISGVLGMELLNGIDHKALQTKLLKTV